MSGQNHRRLESLLLRDTPRATKQKPWLQIIEEKLDAILTKLATIVEAEGGESAIATVDAGSSGVATAGKSVKRTERTKKETK